MCAWETIKKSKFWELFDYISVQEFFWNCRTYIPSIRRILISILILDRLGYSFPFGTGKVKLYQDSLLIGTGVLYGSLYRLELSSLPSVSATLTVNTASSSKILRLNEKSSHFWHQRLGHISKQIMERLIQDIFF